MKSPSEQMVAMIGILALFLSGSVSVLSSFIAKVEQFHW
jgi:hypothetical protein